MSEMVEKVARAIASKHYADRFDKPAEDEHVKMNVNAGWRIFADDARLAIEAMRDPTDEMVEASWSVTKSRTREQYMAVSLANPRDAHRHKAMQRYRAMIDAALTKS